MTCIDFVESNSHCSICNRTIKSNIAILHNDMILGRTCAKNQNINLSKIPNLTKGLINDNEAGSETESSTKPSSKTEEMIDKKSCKEYLMLRCDKLSDIKSMNTEKLNEIYEKSKHSEISNEDFYYLCNLIKKMNREKTVFSERNIHFCYIMKFELHRLINKTQNNNFFKDLLAFLRQHAHLTEKQFESIKNNLKLKTKYVTVCQNPKRII